MSATKLRKKLKPPKPFFPDFEPKKPDFEPEIDPDYDDSCPVCTVSMENHSVKQLVECALMAVRYPTGGKSH